MLALLLAASVAASCPLASEKPMIEAQLFFGRDIAGRAPVSDKEWTDFVAAVLARDFPDGFTVSDGNGEWRDPVFNAVVREQTKIVVIATAPSPDFAKRLQDVTDAYRARFHQQSVGVITQDVCASF
ncbi:MAG TPA: DUF3574 domain-containing protein [Rhizomicrobium sp.]|jgi:hypothetical protein|nr:DUF3574 domain-containing protein [Rhizomicrobium sp.]